LKLVDTFADAGNPHAEWYLRRGAGKYVEKSDAIVLDFDGKRAWAACDANGRRGSPRVAMNVGERFLHDAEHGKFQFLFHAAEIIRDVNLDGNSAALGKEFSVRTKRRDEPCFFQHGRMQEG
jgi:hypothetical protein